jgi:Cu(I)/Ag(I) efflux system protein CusF
MRKLLPILAVALIAGCQPAPEAPAPATATPAPAAAPAVAPTSASEAKRASASGVVQSVDVPAHTLVIAHGPVESLGWPAMTMNFKAPDVDLSQIKAGDEVNFEFTTTGMDGTIVSISKR